MKKGKLIGKGMTAEVYEWGRDKVLKLYLHQRSDIRIKQEAENGYEVHEAGVLSPAVFDIIEIDGRKGIIFERISGKSMLKLVNVEPWKSNYYAEKMAGLHFRMHECSANRLPSQRKRFEYAIRESSHILGNKLKIILDYFERLPDGERVCHGDLHFDNIIVSANDLVTIDWSNAYKGNPLGDVARTCLMISSPYIPYETPFYMLMALKFGKQITHMAYLKEYVRLAKVKIEEIDAWMLPVAAVRLREKIPGEEKWLMDTITRRINQLDNSAIFKKEGILI